ncbi:MAG: aldehyde dehydrogenase family protein, partial [Acidovorax sp.]|nr:aldehyde dehydrogenase family protein [Acidovorax sp.]
MSLPLTRPDLIRSATVIAGQWTAFDGPRLEVTNPATGAVITSVPDSGSPEALAALDAAHLAFPTWRK